MSEQMGHQNIQLTVKLYGHLQPGANRHWMNKLPGAKKPKTKRAVATSGNWRQKLKKAANADGQIVDFKSGTRDSNPRLQPWQIGGRLKIKANTVHAVHFWSTNSPVTSRLRPNPSLNGVEWGRTNAKPKRDEYLIGNLKHQLRNAASAPERPLERATHGF